MIIMIIEIVTVIVITIIVILMITIIATITIIMKITAIIIAKTTAAIIVYDFDNNKHAVGLYRGEARFLQCIYYIVCTETLCLKSLINRSLRLILFVNYHLVMIAYSN